MTTSEAKPRLSEADLQRAVIARAQMLDWKVMHPLPGQTKKGWATATQGDGKGYPDLTLVRDRIVWVELKAEGKYLSSEQRKWRDWIQAAGGEWYCLKPRQWFDGTVDMILEVKLPYPLSDDVYVDESDERWQRLVLASSGDRGHARQVYNALKSRAAPLA